MVVTLPRYALCLRAGIGSGDALLLRATAIFRLYAFLCALRRFPLRCRRRNSAFAIGPHPLLQQWIRHQRNPERGRDNDDRSEKTEDGPHAPMAVRDG